MGAWGLFQNTRHGERSLEGSAMYVDTRRMFIVSKGWRAIKWGTLCKAEKCICSTFSVQYRHVAVLCGLYRRSRSIERNTNLLSNVMS